MAISEDAQAIINKLEEVKESIDSVFDMVEETKNFTVNAINSTKDTLHKDNVLAIQEELNERGYVKKYNLDKIAADVAAKKR